MAFTHPSTQKPLASNSTQVITPPPAYGHDPTLDCTASDFDDHSSASSDDEETSSIRLRICAPLTITGDNNLVAIDTALSPAKIAMAIVDALKQMSMGSGVPMIDEEGRPRPILVEVMAVTRIDGSKNVVGEKAVLATVAGKTKSESEASEDAGVGRKRQREEAEVVEGEGEKRVKTQ